MKYKRQAAWRARNPWARYVEFARRRCTDINHKSFKFHGAKGIECRLSAADLKHLWERDGAAKMKIPSLDRINPDGHYEVSNCRFLEKAVNERLPHDATLAAELAEDGCFT